MRRPLYLLASLIILISCRKDSFIKGNNASIELSADTLHFDTLFTGTGSTTQAFKLFNTNDQKLLISNISLGGGTHSYFKINADGFEGPEVKNIEIAANDSIYIYVAVNIEPSSPGLPFIVQDSIDISYNGNKKSVQLDAWGQNANFLRAKTITANTTWTSDKPYVILDSLKIEKDIILTLEKGTKVYFHNNAPLLVDGTLKANGEKVDSMEVVFTGDRLDDPYKFYPGSWPGIYFRDDSKDNSFTHVNVKNATQGIVVANPSANSNPKLVLDKCIIDNCYDAGLIASNTSVKAVNCLISNCGKNVELASGGQYSFLQCTVASYSNTLIAHKDPVLTISNSTQQGSNDLHADFTNCIFWGDNGIVNDEVVASKQGNSAFVVSFTNCLWKVVNQPEVVTSTNMIVNQDPKFQNIDTRNNNYDFHPGKDSPALAAGTNAGVTTDLEDNPRDLNFPVIGAYETVF